GTPPHVSAAREAQEEAGALGAVCPVALGSYRYRKRQRSGASLMVDVEVFPLALTDELDTWKEQDERERRWFPLGEAAEAVDEPDLRELIRSFASADFRTALRPSRLPLAVTQTTGMSAMFAWFQRLLPKTGNFFELFEAHAATGLSAAEATASPRRPHTCAWVLRLLAKAGNFFGLFDAHAGTVPSAAEATARLLEGSGEPEQHVREIIEREHDADEITREVLQTVRRTFLTP